MLNLTLKYVLQAFENTFGFINCHLVVAFREDTSFLGGIKIHKCESLKSLADLGLLQPVLRDDAGSQQIQHRSQHGRRVLLPVTEALSHVI